MKYYINIQLKIPNVYQSIHLSIHVPLKIRIFLFYGTIFKGLTYAYNLLYFNKLYAKFNPHIYYNPLSMDFPLQSHFK